VLLENIVSRQYEAGDLLPKEQALAEQFDMSRGTVREALRALEERRVVLVRHGRGALVRPAEEWNVLDPVVARALASGRKRREFLREVGALRQILEPEAAALAAERASEKQRAELRVRGEELTDAVDVVQGAKRIRRLVADASGNRPLAGTLRALDDALEQELRAKDVDACARLAEAVAAGDPDAARAVVRELNSAG
jgi:GntR family transcriptional regulator, galactonate operon transcriptional repressor